MLLIDSAGLSDVGRKRRENQDCFCVEDRLKLYVVADGMGGHLAGAISPHAIRQDIELQTVLHTKAVVVFSSFATDI